MPGLPRSARLRRERGFLRFLTKDGSSALHRIREYQAVCRVCLRPIEASDNFWQRVFDIPAVAPPLELQVHVHLELQRGRDSGDIEDPLPKIIGCFDGTKAYPADGLVLTYPVKC